MRTLIFLGLFVSTSLAEPSYLVHITTERPRISVFKDGGSGCLVDPQYILTCSHNIEQIHSSITVRFKNGDEAGATLFKRNRIFNLALLKLDSIRYESPVILSEQKVSTGQTITVWGFSGPQPSSVTGTIKIVGIRRAMFRFDGQGYSGSPIIIDGKLVGVETGLFPGIRFLNTPQLRKFLKEIP